MIDTPLSTPVYKRRNS